MNAEPFSPSGADAATVPAALLSARARHFQERDWASVVRLNRMACERECAQHGLNPESQSVVAAAWAQIREAEQTLAAALDFLRRCHEQAPFLFENAATFAALGRELLGRFVGGLPPGRSKALLATVADYVAGTLGRDDMVEIVEELWAARALRPGMRVKTLRGAVEGVVLCTRADGRVLWRPKGSHTEWLAEPGSLIPARPGAAG